jgi:hypothetical protein
MRRREFIRTASAIGVGVAFGIPYFGKSNISAIPAKRPIGHIRTRYTFPTGGCTESGMVFLDKGPTGRDPFNFHV